MKKVLGVNDDRDFCECCGKNNLTRVVWIEDTETSAVKHYGTHCASMILKSGKKGVETAIYLAADKMYNEVAEMFWAITDRKELDRLMAAELKKRGAENMIFDIRHNINHILKHNQ